MQLFKLTESEYKMLPDLYRQGLSLSSIAKMFHVTKEAIRLHLLRLGVPLRARGCPDKIAKSDKTVVIKDYKAGMPMHTIAKRYKVSVGCIRKILQDAKVPRVRRFKYDLDLIKTAIKLRGEGLSYNKIGKKLNVSGYLVWYWCNVLVL